MLEEVVGRRYKSLYRSLWMTR